MSCAKKRFEVGTCQRQDPLAIGADLDHLWRRQNKDWSPLSNKSEQVVTQWEMVSQPLNTGADRQINHRPIGAAKAENRFGGDACAHRKIYGASVFRG